MRTSIACSFLLLFAACSEGGLPVESNCGADLGGTADLARPPTPVVLAGTAGFYTTNGVVGDVRDALGGASGLADVLSVAEGFGFDNLTLSVPFTLGYPWTRLGEDAVTVFGQPARTFDVDLDAGGDALWDRLGASRERVTADGPVRETKTARISCLRPAGATAARCTVHGVLSATVR